MRFAGIVAEYNPFHNGHAYQIEQTRKAGATHIAVVMSGHIVQRGDIPCFSKWTRAEAAIHGGADLVIELPAIYACSSAERFAYGAVSLLNAFGLPGILSFGSECGDLEALNRCVAALDGIDNTPELRDYLDRGFSFPNARARAIADKFGEPTAAILNEPNNILAAEYLRSLQSLSSHLIPFTVRREGAMHDSRQTAGRFASASRLREVCQLASVRQIEPFVPPDAYRLYRQDYALGRAGASLYQAAAVVLYHLRSMSAEQFAALPDVGEGLENKLVKASRQACTLDELLLSVKSKRYPLSRVKRVIAYAMLGITREIVSLPPAYLRVLAFNERGQEILRQSKKTAILPIYHSFAKLERDFPLYTEPESLATELFRLSLPRNCPALSEYRDQRPNFIRRDSSVR
ncbi:MAG: nucleotidyltransferase family protein [Candidatus Merdivicinus sp.]|jgi:predicted nucleotidyltransferase